MIDMLFLKNRSILLTLMSFLLLSFSPYTDSFSSKKIINYKPSLKSNNFEYINYVVLDKSYFGFKEALAFKESCGKYNAVNKLGYLGKYQFGVSTLMLLGVDDSQYFCPTLNFKKKCFLPI